MNQAGSRQSHVSSSPIAGREKAPSSDGENAAFVDEVLDYNRRARTGFDYAVREAIHFIGGDHWIQFMPHTQRFGAHEHANWIPTPTTNLVGRTFDRLLDILLQGDPEPNAVGSTQDQRDLDAAQVARRIMLSEMRRMKSYDQLFTPAAAWLIAAGTTVTSRNWNPHSGQLISQPRMKVEKSAIMHSAPVCTNCHAEYDRGDPRTLCELCGSGLEEKQVASRDDVGKEMFSSKKVAQLDKDGRPRLDEFSLGQVEEWVVNILNWFPSPAANFEQVEQVVEVEVLGVDAIKDTFGSKAARVIAESLDDEEISITQHPHFDHMGVNEHRTERDKAALKFFRQKPGRLFPKGSYKITCAGITLHSDDIDTTAGDLPYSMCRWREPPGSFWGMGPLRDLIRLNKRINAIDSHVTQNRKKMVSPQWLIPQGSGVQNLDGRAGLTIPYDPHGAGGAKPEIVPGVPLPPQVMDERRQVMSDYQEISGEMEVLLGRIPPGVESGYQVDLLVEQALKRFGPIYRRFRNMLAGHCHEVLILTDENWDEARRVTVIGENQDVEAYNYRGADLRSARDMTVTMTSDLESSPSVRRQRIERAMEMGLLGDPRRPEIRGKLLARLNIEGFDAEYNLDAKKARRAIMAAEDGGQMPPLIPGIDNAAVQMQVLKEHLLTYEFEQSDEGVQRALMERAQELMELLQREQQKAAAAAEAVKGTDEATSQRVAESGAMGESAVPMTA